MLELVEKFEDLIPDKDQYAELLSDNNTWFYKNRDRLRTWYDGMFLVVYKRHVIATFYEEELAYKWMEYHDLMGKACMYHCVYGDDYYKSTIPVRFEIL